MYKMMKKGMFPRIAAVMLMLTLLSTCVISGTFAKYIDTGKASAIGRVAKWGVVINAEGATSNGYPFKTKYTTDTKDIVDYVTGAPIKNSVISLDTQGVFAPGTSGSLGAISISGKPEVAVKVSYESTVVDFGNEENWTIVVDAESAPRDEVYCPLVFSIGGHTIKWGADLDVALGLSIGAIDSLEDMKAAIEAAIKDFEAYYDAGTDLGNLGDTAEGEGGTTIEWAWPYYVNDETDKKDTLLAANNPTITFTLTVTVEQVN